MQDNVSIRIKSAIEASGMTMKAVAEKCGIPYRTLQDYAAGKADPSAKNLSTIATGLRVSGDWLLTGEGEMRGRGSISNVEFLGIQMVPMEVYSLAGAGGPIALTDSEPLKIVYVLPEWKKPSTVAVSVRGDSMQPGIMDGSTVGIDTADRQIVSGKVFAVYIEHEGAVIKRVYAEAERVVLKSDNPAFEPIYIKDGHGFILGRLRWAVQEY